MQLKNLSFFLCLWFLSTAINAAITGVGVGQKSDSTVIIFVNGINNEPAAVAEATEDLISKLNTFGVKKGDYAYSHFYNPTDGLRNDIDELTLQAKISDEFLAGRQSNKQDYYQQLGRYYNSQYELINASPTHGTETLRRVVRVANLLKIRIIDAAKNRTGVVLVPHSQGNFYVEAAYAMLTANADVSTLNKVRVVGVASVAATTPNNRYISSSVDRALKAQSTKTHNSLLNLNTYDILPAIDIPCIGSDCDAQINWNGIDESAHGFTEVYLNSGITNKSGVAFPKIITDMVKASLVELNAPAPIVLTAQTVLQNGLYELDTSGSAICYVKSQLTQGTDTVLLESKYCLNNGAWIGAPLNPSLLLLPDNSWFTQALPQVAVTGNTTFDVKYSGQKFREGTIALYATTATGNVYQSTVTTPSAEYKLFNPMNVSSIGALITTWNSSANGSSYQSRGGALGWSFLGLSTDLQNTAPLYDISIPCQFIGTPPTCNRNILAYSTWDRTTLGNRTETSEILKLNIPADRRSAANLATNEQVIYVKRSSQPTIEEGLYTEPGNVWQYKSYDKAWMNANLALRQYPLVVN